MLLCLSVPFSLLKMAKSHRKQEKENETFFYETLQRYQGWKNQKEQKPSHTLNLCKDCISSLIRFNLEGEIGGKLPLRLSNSHHPIPQQVVSSPYSCRYIRLCKQRLINFNILRTIKTSCLKTTKAILKKAPTSRS